MISDINTRNQLIPAIMSSINKDTLIFTPREHVTTLVVHDLHTTFLKLCGVMRMSEDPNPYIDPDSLRQDIGSEDRAARVVTMLWG